MPDDLETLVRKSLDVVDRSRRFAAITTGVVFVLFVLTLGFLFAHARVGDPGAAKMLWVALAAQRRAQFAAGCCALSITSTSSSATAA
jgi:hypothetical protein